MGGQPEEGSAGAGGDQVQQAEPAGDAVGHQSGVQEGGEGNVEGQEQPEGQQQQEEQQQQQPQEQQQPEAIEGVEAGEGGAVVVPVKGATVTAGGAGEAGTVGGGGGKFAFSNLF